MDNLWDSFPEVSTSAPSDAHVASGHAADIWSAFPEVGAAPSGASQQEQQSPPPHKFGLMDTWPVRMAKDIYSAVTTPGDVYAGKVDPGSDEAIGRAWELAKVAAPVSAAMRGGEGVAGVSVAPRPHIPPTAGMEAARTAAELGAPLPIGLASDSAATQAVTQAARSLPLVGAKIGERAGETVTKAGEAVTGLAEELGSGITDRATAGTILRPSLRGVIESNNTKIDDAFANLRSMINPKSVSALPRTEATFNAVMEERTAAGSANPIAGLEDVQNLVSSGGSFNGLQRARSDIGHQIEFGKANPGFNAGDLKRIYGAMSSDMEGVATSAVRQGVSHESAVIALRDANQTAAPIIESNAKIQRVLGSRTEESLVGSLVNTAQAKTGDVQLLAKLRAEMPKEDFQQIGAVTLSELGHNPTTGKFSLNQFATKWDKMGDRAKAVMFEPAHSKMLDDIAGLARHLKDAEQYINKSQTGMARAVTGGLTAGAGAVGALATQGDIMPVLAAVLAAGGGWALSSWLSRPATAATLAKWSRAANAYRMSPTPAKAAVLRISAGEVIRLANEQQRGTVTVRPYTQSARPFTPAIEQQPSPPISR